ncbi:OmpW/AlkL family protein [Halomonas mongoliensis]|uniref:OmpW family outer membrane protein n=1 Tax=Halomonas mongoliensis TaxID=321265 RepID=A0ABU1GPT9_9GAMM|nr:OmpW family outer membrane protein [Halomonas mongoliensis]MDR5894044.1 OmpW family outer membrane protein [Halomonas mongoliensis]
MRTSRLITAAAIAASCAFASQAALAYSAGDTFVRGGFAKSDTRSDNGVADGISSGETGFTFGAGYLFHDNIGVELNSSEKIEHTVNGDDTIDRMPVNLLVNYYPLGGMDSRVQPYVGAGLNYTRFSGEPEGVDARRSYGAVGQVGVDLAITENLMLNGFANYADVDSRISVDGERLGTAKVDPMTIGGGVTLRF